MKTARVAPVRFTARASATGSREYARASFAAGSAARKTGEYGYSTPPGPSCVASQAAGAATARSVPVGIVRGSETALGASAAAATIAAKAAARAFLGGVAPRRVAPVPAGAIQG